MLNLKLLLIPKGNFKEKKNQVESLTEDNTNTYNTDDSHDDHHLEERERKKVGVQKHYKIKSSYF